MQRPAEVAVLREPFGVDGRCDPTQAVIWLQGEIDLQTAPQVWSVAWSVLRRAPRQVVFDLSELRFIDVIGMRVVRSAELLFGSRQIGLVLRSPTPWIRRVLGLGGLAGLVEESQRVAESNGTAAPNRVAESNGTAPRATRQSA